MTGLRGVAALYVVLHHFLGVSLRSGPALTVKTVIIHAIDNIVAHGYFAVDLFFVLSGFVMALNYRHMFVDGFSIARYRRFLGRRIARIYPLYLAATIVAFLLVAAGWISYKQSAPLGFALFFNVIMIQAWGFVRSFDGPAWSISAEWAAYLMFPAILAPTMFGKAVVAWIWGLSCVAMIGVLCLVSASLIHEYIPFGPLDLANYTFGLPVLRCIPEFALGILAFRSVGTSFGAGIASSRWFAPLVCLAILALVAVPRSDLAVVLLFPLLVISLSTQANVAARLLASAPAELLGKLSYSIYLIHSLLNGVRNWVIDRAHVAGVAHGHLSGAAIAVSLTFAFSYVAYRTIELPGRRRLRQLFEGGSTKSPQMARVRTS